MPHFPKLHGTIINSLTSEMYPHLIDKSLFLPALLFKKTRRGSQVQGFAAQRTPPDFKWEPLTMETQSRLFFLIYLHFKTFTLWLFLAELSICPAAGHSESSEGITCCTHHICQWLLSTSKNQLVQKKVPLLKLKHLFLRQTAGCMEQWVNQETCKATHQGAQPVRSCNPLSADDIKPIIPEQARWI